MSDKEGVGVTVISHDSESRTHLNSVSPGCSSAGCYRKDVTYTGVSTGQLAALTRVSQNCEQFIKFECNNDVSFIEDANARWVSRDRRRMNHWGGTTGYKSMCAYGVTNFYPNSAVRSVIVTPLAVVGDRTAVCWQTSRLLKVLTHKSALPVTHSQIRLGDRLGWFTRGRLSHIRQTQMLWTGMTNFFCYKKKPGCSYSLWLPSVKIMLC